MKLLYVTTAGGTMHFFISLIHTLIQNGDTVDIAANTTESDVPPCYREWGCRVYPLPCSRSPYDKGNLQAIKEIRRIAVESGYDLVHCHTPIAAMCVRAACRKLRKTGLAVFYTAHGFHFYKGAPWKNWLLYYPVEWLCAHWTDVLITINREDYALAQKHMHAGRVEYVPGVGIDLKKFAPGSLSREEKERLRESVGVKEGDRLLLSVGELIDRKNHESVIRALAKLNDPHIQYCICGKGDRGEYLQKLIDDLHLTESVHLLGFRTDISDLCECADLFVFPSFQEGLPVALMEAIASRTPVICSDIRGNRELVQDEQLFECGDIDGIAAQIRRFLNGEGSKAAEQNYRNLRQFDIAAVISDMETLYSYVGGVTRHLYEIDRQQELRRSIGVPPEASLLLSVGELNRNKNHEAVIRALAALPDKAIHYAIAGTGGLQVYLNGLAESLGVGDRVHLLGFRSDVALLYRSADLYIHPSRREGLPVAVMEAIASGTSVLCSDIRGCRDLADPETLFHPDGDGLAEKIQMQLSCAARAVVEKNYANLIAYDEDAVIDKMRKLYQNAL